MQKGVTEQNLLKMKFRFLNTSGVPHDRTCSTSSTLILHESHPEILMNSKEIYGIAYNPLQEVLLEVPEELPLPMKLSNETHVKKQCKTIFFNNNVTVEQYLSLSSKGLAVLEAYRTNNSLDKSDRRNSVQVVINGALDRHESVRSSVLDDLALFPNEVKETYFYNKLSSKNAKGKLVDKYKTEISYRRKNSRKTQDQKMANTATDEDFTTEIKWLQNSDSPWNKVQSYWERPNK